VDPKVDLFRRLDPTEIPPTINGIRGSTSLVVVITGGLSPSIVEASKILLEALGQKEVSILPEEEAPPSRLMGHDVLYVGIPKGKHSLPSLPEGLFLSSDRFTLEGDTYDASTDALFIVLPHPGGGGRITGLFLPLSGEAAAIAVRKIPHYGKYSYLGFRAGVNRAKGTWPTTTSPLVHHFTFREASP
jgi:hypothetical protein